MKINHTNPEGYFYAKNPQVDAQNRLTFNSNNCTHFVILSCLMEHDPDILSDGVLEGLSAIDFAHNDGNPFEIGVYKVRIVKQTTYIAAGNYVKLESKMLGHAVAVYGCVYVGAEDRLDLFIPDKVEESRTYIPYNVAYTVRKQMSEGRKGFLGIGKTDPTFTGVYIIQIEPIQDYEDGTIYYTIDNYDYPITKEMLGKSVFVKAAKDRSEPILRDSVKGINLVRK